MSPPLAFYAHRIEYGPAHSFHSAINQLAHLSMRESENPRTVTPVRSDQAARPRSRLGSPHQIPVWDLGQVGSRQAELGGTEWAVPGSRRTV